MLLQTCAPLYVILISSLSFAEEFPRISGIDIDVQYCEKVLPASNQLTLIKMKLLAQLSEQQNTSITGSETLQDNKLSRSIHLSTESYQTTNTIYYKTITFNTKKYVCAYKKGLHYEN